MGGGGDRADLGHHGCGAPVECWGGRAVDPVGLEIGRCRGGPREIQRVRRHAGGGGKGHRRRCFGDDHIVDVPAVLVDGGIGDEAEADSDIGKANQGRKIELFAGPGALTPCEGCSRGTPREPAVDGGLNVGEVVAVFKLVAVAEAENRARRQAEIHRGCQRQRRIHRSRIVGRWAVGGRVRGRRVESGGVSPRRGGGPVAETALKVVGEWIVCAFDR